MHVDDYEKTAAPARPAAAAQPSAGNPSGAMRSGGGGLVPANAAPADWQMLQPAATPPSQRKVQGKPPLSSPTAPMASQTRHAPPRAVSHSRGCLLGGSLVSRGFLVSLKKV